VVKDVAGEIAEIHATYDPATRGGNAPDGRRVQGTIHWVSVPHGLDTELRLYDRLFSVPDPDALPDGQDFVAALNPTSLVAVRSAKVEPSVGADPPGSRYQFERTGYFVSDPVDSRPEALVFNRTVALRDSWAKVKDR
jgi:glutaminyl-tRNA synthetase